MVNDDRLSAALLDYLRESFGDNSLDYASRPARVPGGYDTAIYTFELQDSPANAPRLLILRVFELQNPWIRFSTADRTRFETVVQNALHGLGYPAPRVVLTCGDAAHLGAPFLVMERIPGRIMLDLFFRPSPLILRLPRLLAEAQARLHDLDPSNLLER